MIWLLILLTGGGATYAMGRAAGGLDAGIVAFIAFVCVVAYTIYFVGETVGTVPIASAIALEVSGLERPADGVYDCSREEIRALEGWGNLRFWVALLAGFAMIIVFGGMVVIGTAALVLTIGAFGVAGLAAIFSRSIRDGWFPMAGGALALNAAALVAGGLGFRLLYVVSEWGCS